MTPCISAANWPPTARVGDKLTSFRRWVATVQMTAPGKTRLYRAEMTFDA